MPSNPTEIAKQREYYARTADSYDEKQINPNDEHTMALSWLTHLAQANGLTRILDIGSGTGRAMSYLNQSPSFDVHGIEPSKDLREIAYSKGISADKLIEGNALKLDFPDDHFDIVCCFGVLHHIKDHKQAVREMCRVAKTGIFISDANNFGQGTLPNRIMKQILRAFGLWPLFDFIKTKGKGYHYSEGDGVFYSYSVFYDIPIIKSKFSTQFFMSTRPSGANLYRSAQTIALFARR